MAVQWQRKETAPLVRGRFAGRAALTLGRRDLPETAAVRGGDDVRVVRTCELQVVDGHVRQRAETRPGRRCALTCRGDEDADVAGLDRLATRRQQDVVAGYVRQVVAVVGPGRAAVRRLEAVALTGGERVRPRAREAVEDDVDVSRVRRIDRHRRDVAVREGCGQARRGPGSPVVWSEAAGA